MSEARELLIDQLARAAHDAPNAPLLADRAIMDTGAEWRALTNARAWALSGAVASWLIAQGYGPGARPLAVPAGDTPQRVVMLLGAMRAGALVVEGPSEVTYAVLANCPVDASVAERRLHIDADTPARQIGDVCRRHGDFVTIAEAVKDRF